MRSTMLGWVVLGAILAVNLWRLAADRRLAEHIAAQRPGDRPRLAGGPRVTVLVAAWNEAANIRGHIEAILALEYPALEYVLCAGGDDGTYELAAAVLRGRGTLLRQEPGEGKQRALRRALTHCTGEIIYLTDADCVVNGDAFARVIAPLVAGAPAATGRSRPLRAETRASAGVLCRWAPQYVAEAHRGETSAGLLGRNCAVRRDALARAGDFAGEAATGTDYHLARALLGRGDHIAFARWSFVESRADIGLRAYVRQQSRWLRNHWLHASQTGDTRLQLHAARTWVIGGLLVGLLWLRPLVGGWATMLWLALLLHGSLARVRYVRFLQRAEGLPLDWTPLVAAPLWFIVDAGCWVRSLADMLIPTRRHRW